MRSWFRWRKSAGSTPNMVLHPRSFTCRAAAPRFKPWFPAQLTGPPGVAANLRGADLIYFAMTDDRMGYQLVTRPEIKSASELKGKRFAISRFASSADFGVRALLRRLGVDPKDVTILQIGNEADRLAALRSGSV